METNCLTKQYAGASKESAPNGCPLTNAPAKHQIRSEIPFRINWPSNSMPISGANET